jgi:hypothetical protein
MKDISPNQIKASSSQSFINIVENFDFYSGPDNWSDKNGKPIIIDRNKGLWGKLKKLRYKYLPVKWLITSTGTPTYWQWRWLGQDLFKTKWKG